MADELIENAEYGKKRKDEEPPILVAQRFLNIYRQMHIFNRERQEEFDNMLMEMTPEVRILLSTLPGGGLLLEHIAEIEQKKGVVSSSPLKQVVTRKKDLSSNIQISPSLMDEHQMQGGGGGVVIDASFASELSSSLSAALQQTEKKHKEDIKTLTETITHSIMESQTAMVSMMRDILVATKTSNALHNQEKDNSSFIVPSLNPTPKKAEVPPVQPKAPETKPVTPAQPMQPKAQENSLYKSELDKIKSAIQDNVKSSIADTPISLDDFDNSPLSLDDIEEAFSFDIKTEDKENNISTPSDIVNESDDWEWEYVDGNADSDDWEWEYVDDNADSDDWEWEYVEEEEPGK